MVWLSCLFLIGCSHTSKIEVDDNPPKQIKTIEWPSKPSQHTSRESKTERSLVLDPKAYLNWIKDNNDFLSKETEFEDNVLRLTYEPNPYIVLRNEGSADLSANEWLGLINEQRNAVYFKMKIWSTAPNGDLLRVKKQLTSDFFKDIKLFVDDSAIPCGLYHVESLPGTIPVITALMRFQLTTADQGLPMKLVVPDNQFLASQISLSIDEQLLNQLPEPLIKQR